MISVNRNQAFMKMGTTKFNLFKIISCAKINEISFFFILVTFMHKKCTITIPPTYVQLSQQQRLTSLEVMVTRSNPNDKDPVLRFTNEGCVCVPIPKKKQNPPKLKCAKQ